MRPARRVAGNSGEQVRFDMGDGAAQITQGFGGMWETVSRSQKVAMTRFVGGDPVGQDVPIFLDGFRDDRSVQRELNRLLRQSIPDRQGAPTIWRITGPIHFPAKLWILADIEFGDAIRDPKKGLVRQQATLKLLEYVPPDQIKIRRRRTITPRGKKRFYTSRSGDTLRAVARRFYGDGSLAKQLGKLQEKPIRDMGKRLDPGTKIRLPRLLGKGYR
jgi:nucleoid-associated protein YgaU